MEEKKLDINSIIGFVLIFGILMYMLWQNQPTPEELEAQEKAKQEQEALKKAASTSRRTYSRRSTRMNPVVKVLTSATFIRSVFGILSKVIKK